jgi:hypothetical protein
MKKLIGISHDDVGALVGKTMDFLAECDPEPALGMVALYALIIYLERNWPSDDCAQFRELADKIVARVCAEAGSLQ